MSPLSPTETLVSGTSSGTSLRPITLAKWAAPASAASSPSSISGGLGGAILNFAVAYVVSSVTEEPPQEIQDLVESVRYPKGAGTAIDH